MGEDPLALDRHARVLETIAFHAGRYWPLEAALWDLAGKAADRPVAELLDGEATRLRRPCLLGGNGPGGGTGGAGAA